jgi:hypothetical protein
MEGDELRQILGVAAPPPPADAATPLPTPELR